MESPAQVPAFGVAAGRQLPFSEPLSSAENAPAPLRAALTAWLQDHRPACPMIYTPAFETAGQSYPGSIFAVSHEDWLWLAEGADGAVFSSASRHDEIRSVALSQILLQGSLELVAASGRARIVFNMVAMELFAAAVQIVLEGAARLPADPQRPAVSSAELDRLSFKLRSALQEFVPGQHSLLRIASWPAVMETNLPWLSRRDVAAGLIVLTDRHLCVLREGLPSRDEPPSRSLDNYGKEIVYLARALPIAWTRESGKGVVNLTISVGGVAAVSVLVPDASLAEVEAVLQASIPRRATE